MYFHGAFAGGGLVQLGHHRKWMELFELLKRILFAICVIALAGSTPASAYRVFFNGRLPDGKVRHDASVCFYRAQSRTTPFEEMLASGEVRCLSASDVIDVPAGVWNIFLTTGDGLISDRTIALKYSGPDASELGYHELDLSLVGAAQLEFDLTTLGPSQYFAAYLPDTVTVLPLSRSAKALTVPGGLEVVPLIIERGRPVAVGSPITIPTGETAVASFHLKGNDIVAWLALDEGAMPDHVPPQVAYVDSSGTAHKPVTSGTLSQHSFVIFQNVVAGHGRLVSDSDAWSAPDLAVDAQKGVTAVSQPFVDRPATVLSVAWTIDSAAVGVPLSLRCSDTDQDNTTTPTQIRARLLSCSALQPGMDLRSFDATGCSTVAAVTAPVPRSSGSLEIPRVPGGLYLLLVNYGAVTSRQTLTVDPRRVPSRSKVSSPIRPIVVTGRVTSGGHPVRAEVRFSTGGALSDVNTGTYVAALQGRQERPIDVVPCDGSETYRYVLKQPLESTATLDIEIPDTAVQVHVSEKGGGNAIGGATVFVKELRDGRDVGVFASAKEPTNSAGDATLHRLPPGLEFLICATREQYARECSSPIRIAEGTMTVDLQMKPTAEKSGRIATTEPFVSAGVWFVSETGRTIENVVAAPDGTFRYTHDISPAEYIVFTAQNAPLTVFPYPLPADLTSLTLPVKRGRSFRVAIGKGIDQSDALVSLVIGSLRVPAEILSLHQALRGMQSMVMGKGPLLLTDVAETATIIVTLGPPSPPALVSGIDFFFMPQYARAYPTKAVTGDLDVIFGK